MSFVYFGPEAWAGMWRNRHHLMSRLSDANKVVYVEPRPYLGETLAALRRGQLELRPSRLTLDRPNLWIYHPPAHAPLGGPRPIRAASHAVRRSAMRRDLARLGVANPIVWISSPTQFDARCDLPAKLRVYHIVDDYLAYHDLPAASRAHFARREQVLIEWADLVIAVSPALLAAKGGGNCKFRLLPNGFDGEAYREGKPAALPTGLASLRRPILGYVGLVSVRLDLALLDALAEAHPEWTLLLVGQVNRNGCAEKIDRLAARPNVTLLPPVPGDEVADFVRSFDMGLVPYRITQETCHASPLKVYEYLAAGLPVVSADVPGVREFGDVLSIGSSFAEWEHAIGSALRDDTPAQHLVRRTAVAGHTWKARVEQLSVYLAEALARR